MDNETINKIENILRAYEGDVLTNMVIEQIKVLLLTNGQIEA